MQFLCIIMIWISNNIGFHSLESVGRGGGSPAAEEDPDRWERAGSDPGSPDPGHRQAGGEEQGSAEREFIFQKYLIF